MMRRVLHVLPDLIPYGLERVVASLATLGNRERYQVAVASLYPEAPESLAASLRAEGVQVFHLDKRRGLDLRMLPRLARVVREFRPDVVHSHNYVLRYSLPVCLWHKTPLLVHTIHNVADREVDRLGVWLQRRAFRSRVRPVVIAEQAAISFERVYGMARPPLIMNGIPVERYASAAEARPAWRAAQGFTPDDLLFTCVARFDPQKNHKTLIEAFAAGPAQVPNVTLLLAGSGQLQQQIEQQVSALGLSARVRFLGRRDDVPELLAASDAFVLASLWEGNPLSVMEAMSAGLPLAVTAAGGVPELATDNEHGFVAPPGDAAALAAAMMRLAQNSELRNTLGSAAQTRARSRFDECRMVQTYESLYDQLLRNDPQGKINACAIS